MNDPESSTVFAGVDGRTDTELLDWYCRTQPVDKPQSFAAADRDLPQAVETTVAYQKPYTDECVETEWAGAVEARRLRVLANEAPVTLLDQAAFENAAAASPRRQTGACPPERSSRRTPPGPSGRSFGATPAASR